MQYYTLDQKCFEVFDIGGREATLYRLEEKVSDAENIYRISFVKGPSLRKIEYAVKQTEDNYLTAQPKTCEEVCGVKGAKSVPEILKNPFEIPQAAQKDTNPPKKAAWCTTVNQCRGLKEKGH